MTFERIAPPEFGAPLDATHASPDTLKLLALRRSTPSEFFTGPGPDDDTLAALLEIAARVPDHRRLSPFRFIIIKGEARERFGAYLAGRLAETDSAASPEKFEAEKRRFMLAPVTVAVVARLTPGHKTPEWEQELTCGAACFNLLIAASAAGFAGQWVTEWFAYDAPSRAHLGLDPAEKIAGFIHLGTARERPRERARPVMADIVSVY